MDYFKGDVLDTKIKPDQHILNHIVRIFHIQVLQS